jgi:hypothetical protein
MNHTIIPDNASSDAKEPNEASRIEKMLKQYNLQSDRLFGLLLQLSYEECHVLTCDAWKLKCGGVSRGKFLILKLCSEIVHSYPELGRQLLLVHILDTTPLPVEEEILITLLQLHKLQVKPDPITNADLHWVGLKAQLLGMYYDSPESESENQVEFGGDLDLFLSPHSYECYSPTEEDLFFLLNLFVLEKPRYSIGRLRYSESLAFKGMPEVSVLISPSDLIGFRSGVLGPTRLGKSNLLKILADILMRSELNVGLLIIDPSGEYTYLNEQDKTSLYFLHKGRSVRYSLSPRLSDEERQKGLTDPQHLGVNFYEQVVLGHSIIANLYDTEHDKRPDYVQPLLAWQPIDPKEVNDSIQDFGERTRYRRSLSMYQALLFKAGFRSPAGFTVKLSFHRELRGELAKDSKLSSVAMTNNKNALEIGDQQTVEAAGQIYTQLYEMYQQERDNPRLFPLSRESALPYFDLLQTTLLKMHGDFRISGPGKFAPFVRFHSVHGSNIIQQIVQRIDEGRLVILDLSNANEEIAGLFSTMICRAILRNQINKFSESRLGDHYVQLLFEEAHRLFPQDDRNLTNIYNILAKEGAKYHIGMFFATQSIGTISPDLLKNSENLFVTHLGDERELKILSNRHEFKEITPFIRKARTRGFVRMISLSNRFVIPVQVNKFGPQGVK